MSKSLKRAFIAIAFFFVCLFGAAGYTIALAVKHSEPILDERYYEKGLDYEKRLSKMRLANEEGWDFETKLLSERNLPYNETGYKIALQIPEGQAPQKVNLTVTIDRPASSKFRVEKTLTGEQAVKRNNEWVFQTDLAMPAPGYADIKLEANIDDRVVLYKNHRAYAVR